MKATPQPQSDKIVQDLIEPDGWNRAVMKENFGLHPMPPVAQSVPVLGTVGNRAVEAIKKAPASPGKQRMLIPAAMLPRELRGKTVEAPAYLSAPFGTPFGDGTGRKYVTVQNKAGKFAGLRRIPD